MDAKANLYSVSSVTSVCPAAHHNLCIDYG